MVSSTVLQYQLYTIIIGAVMSEVPAKQQEAAEKSWISSSSFNGAQDMESSGNGFDWPIEGNSTGK